MKRVLNERDNVGVSLTETDIPAGHKYALRDIKIGEPVIKYGEIIGRATCDIKSGEWVHTHNVRSHLDESVEYEYNYNAVSCSSDTMTFRGYKRSAGRAGVRNDIYIIPTVGCVNNVCEALAKKCQPLIKGSIDGVWALPHQFGCSQLGVDNENIKKLLCGIALNPNATFVLFVGLGCENNGMDGIREYLAPYNRDNIAYMVCQDVSDEIEEGMKILTDFIERASLLQREDIDISELTIGLKCGGSDGYSGITANPTLGKVTDTLVGAGASAILTEVPEMFGAEQILMNKCKNIDVFNRYKKMIEDFKAYYINQGFPVYENPSPGNKKGGITTLEEKSLGCIKKAGSSDIVDVLDYGEIQREIGVSALNAPGNDLIAATALGASGCQVVVFTTGRGTPFSTFVPTIKVSSNDKLASFKSNWIDFNAYTMFDTGLLNLIIKCASGEYKAKSEEYREIAFYKTGVTL